MLQYFQFPKFLLKLRISQNAKFLYMILYDRARISRKNSWIDKYGNVYLIFPIDELSVQIDKCKSSVKIALKELDAEGFLVPRSGGFSKPNHLYVKIPSDGVLFVEGTSDKSIDRKLYSRLFPKYNIILLEGCASVIQATKAYNKLPMLHYKSKKELLIAFLVYFQELNSCKTKGIHFKIIQSICLSHYQFIIVSTISRCSVDVLRR